jgi:hypothetical protein
MPGTPSQLATQTSQTSGQTSFTLNLGSGIAAGTLVVIEIEVDNNGTAVGDPTSVAAGANSYAKAASSSRSTDEYTSTWWFFYSGAPGAQTVTVTLPASANMTFSRAWASTGWTSPAVDCTATGQGLGTSAALSPLPSATTDPNALIFLNLMYGSGSAATGWAPTNYTTLGQQNNGTRGHSGAYAYRQMSATSSENPVGTIPSSNWSYNFVAFKETGGGGSSPQTVTVTGKTSSSSLGTVTAVPGPITSTPSSVASQSSFGAITVRSNINVPVTGPGSQSSFGTVTARPGNLNVPVAGKTSSSSFGTVTTGGGSTVPVAGIGSQSAFGAVTAFGGPTSVPVPGLATEAQFGSIAFSGGDVNYARPYNRPQIRPPQRLLRTGG